MSIRIELGIARFSELEQELVSNDRVSVSAFKYSSGVKALRLKTPKADIVVLPYQGQQIWRAEFGGRDITMGSMFSEPVDTQVYLETYGAFFIHCGLTGLGAPGPKDSHPLHGELPNAPFQNAWLELDERTGTVAVCGTYKYTVAFSCNYLATAKIILGLDDNFLTVDLSVENKRNVPMDLMYLGHANFRPVDYGELVYAAKYTPEHVRVRKSIPSHISPPEGYVELIEELAKDPAKHHTFDPQISFDPEVVFAVDMMTGDDGWTHAIQKHPNGVSDFISYQPHQAPVTGRWLCRTADQQGLGIAFPATSGVEGYHAEKDKGLYVELAAKETWNISMLMGVLNEAETNAMERTIDQIVGR
ncbi:MAG: DUF4432 family protein [Hyphomicrobiales bacterium]